MKTHMFLLLILVACLSSTASRTVILYDSSRDIYVMLTDTQAFFNIGQGSDPNADYWYLIGQHPTGTWTSDTRFTGPDGYFEQAEGDNWVEVQDSGTILHFVRVQPGETPNSSGDVEISNQETIINEPPRETEISVSSGDHLVVLYDESRDIYVMLTDTQAFFNIGQGSDPNADYWYLIGENPTGTWTSDTRFTYPHGYFEQAEGDNWVEVQDSGTILHFVRVQPGETSNSSGEVEISNQETIINEPHRETEISVSSGDHLVVLYDESRDIYVMLTDTQAFFNIGQGSDPNANYWSLMGQNPNGTWTSDTRFTINTGYFEPTQGNDWVERGNSGNTNNFVRVQPGNVIETPDSFGEVVIVNEEIIITQPTPDPETPRVDIINEETITTQPTPEPETPDSFEEVVISNEEIIITLPTEPTGSEIFWSE